MAREIDNAPVGIDERAAGKRLDDTVLLLPANCQKQEMAVITPETSCDPKSAPSLRDRGIEVSAIEQEPGYSPC